jgi:hypothetical protein
VSRGAQAKAERTALKRLGSTVVLGEEDRMDPYRPIYHRPPNKFLRYEERRFDDGAGHTGIKRIALYLDKSGTQREETAQVIWDATNTI